MAEPDDAAAQAREEFIETWARHCGAPRAVFIGHLDVLLAAIREPAQQRIRDLEAALGKTATAIEASQQAWQGLLAFDTSDAWFERRDAAIDACAAALLVARATLEPRP